MATQAELDLYDQVGGNQIPTASTEPTVDPKMLELYDSMRNEDQTNLSQVKAPGAPDDVVAARRQGRPDLLSQTGQAVENSPLGGLNPLTLLGGVGGAIQKIESGKANLINNMMGKPIQGDTTNLEIGDLLAKGGVPDAMAATGGLIIDSVTDPTGVMRVAGRGAGAIAHGLKEAGKFGLNKAVQLGHLIAGQHPDQVAQLAKKGYAQIVNENLDRSGIGLNKIADSIIGDLEKLGTVVSDAYKAFKPTAKVAVPELHARALGDALRTELADEVVPQVADALKGANLRTVATVVKGNTVSKQREKIVEHLKPAHDAEGATLVNEAGVAQTDVVKKIIDTAATEKTPTLKTSKGAKVKESAEGVTIPLSKTTVREATTYSDKTKNVKYTFQNLVDDLAAGKPVTQQDLYGASRLLTTMAENGELTARANKLKNPIENALVALNPAYARAKAVSAWRKSAEEAADTLFGGVYKAGAGEKAPKYANNATNMMNYFETIPQGPLRTAPGMIDEAVLGALGKTTNYADQVADVAATRGASKMLPKLTPLSLGGGASVAASKMNVPEAVTGAGMGVLLALGSARVTNRLGKALYGNTGPQKAAVKWLNSPAGNFYRNTGIGQTNQEVIKQLGTAPNLVRASVLRQMTGRNDTVEQPVQE